MAGNGDEVDGPDVPILDEEAMGEDVDAKADKKKKKKKKKTLDEVGKKKDKKKNRKVKGTTIVRPKDDTPKLNRTNSWNENQKGLSEEPGAFQAMLALRGAKPRSGTIDMSPNEERRTQKPSKKKKMGFQSMRIPKKSGTYRQGMDSLFAPPDEVEDDSKGKVNRSTLSPAPISAKSNSSTSGSTQTVSNVAFQSLYRAKMAEKRKKEREMFPISGEELDERTIKRNKVLNECINTERDYIRDLEVMIKYFKNPMVELGLMGKAESSVIFSNVSVLVDVNKALYKGLFSAAKEAKGGDNAKIGDCFLEMSAYLKMYSMYCGNQTNSREAINELLKSNAKAKAYVDKQTIEVAELRKLSIKDYLIKPIQRLCKYPLLLRETIKYTEKDHPDYAKLEEAYMKIEQVVASVEESKRQEEDIEAMRKTVSKLEGLDKFNIKLMIPSRRYVTKGDVTLRGVTDAKVDLFFLFSDLIILTSEGVVKKKSKSPSFAVQKLFKFEQVEIVDEGDKAVKLTMMGENFSLKFIKNAAHGRVLETYQLCIAKQKDGSENKVETFTRK